MGVEIHKIDINLPAVTPSRIYQATVFDFVTLAMIVLPQVFKKVDLIRGDGGVGTVRISYLQNGDAIKERVDALDKKKLFYTLTVLRGTFPKGVKRTRTDMTFVAAANGAGTIIKRKTYFYKTSDDPIDESVVNAINEQVTGIFRAFEAYLVANPHA